MIYSFLELILMTIFFCIVRVYMVLYLILIFQECTYLVSLFPILYPGIGYPMYGVGGEGIDYLIATLHVYILRPSRTHRHYARLF